MKRLAAVALLLLLPAALCPAGANKARTASHDRKPASGPVDVRTLAREDHPCDTAAAPAVVPLPPAPESRFTPALVLGMILAAAAGTAGVIVLVQRRSRRVAASPAERRFPGALRHPERTLLSEPKGDTEGIPSESERTSRGGGVEGRAPAELAGQAGSQAANLKALPEPADEEEELLEDRVAALAQGLQRTKGEMDLVRRLESPALPEERFAALRTGDIAAAQRLKTAKRLGVGRGEVDLAVRLRTLAARTQQQES